MLDKYEQEILKALNTSNSDHIVDKYPLYYQIGDDLIREDSDGTKYKIMLDENNQEQIVKKL